MVAKIRREGQEFEIEDGRYDAGDSTDSFMKFQDLLHGHPNGIHRLSVSPMEVMVEIKTHGASEEPIKTKQISGNVGDLEQRTDIGHYESTIYLNLFNGAGVNLKSQGSEMQITHVKKPSETK